MAKLSKKDIESSITKIVPKKTSIVKEIIYDKAGNLVDILPSDQIMAKFISGQNLSAYYVRVNCLNDLYNPKDRHYIDDSYMLSRTRSLEPFKLVKTNKDCFDQYLTFLRTGIDLHLRQAQGKL